MPLIESQTTQYTCLVCEQPAVVTPVLGQPWTWAWYCPYCQTTGVLAWDLDAPPPAKGWPRTPLDAPEA